MPHTFKGCARISLWTGPRNISTAFMYAFRQRRDTLVVDEPYYGHYLRVSGMHHPGGAEVIAAMDCQGDQVTQSVILAPYDRPIVFFKNMTHHLVALDLGFLEHTINILLTRDPVDMIPSQAKGLGRTPTLQDTGYKAQVELFEHLQRLGQAPPVIDSKILLHNPEAVLRQLCQRIDIPFDQAMLSWPAGPKPEDGIWAKYWYHRVHQSTKFDPYRPKTVSFPDSLRPLLAQCQPYYEQLLPYTIKAPS